MGERTDEKAPRGNEPPIRAISATAANLAHSIDRCSQYKYADRIEGSFEADDPIDVC